MTAQEDLYEQVLALRDLLITACEGDIQPGQKARYTALREDLLREPIAVRLPPFLKRHHTLPEFWSYIKGVSGQWAPRRQHVYEAFAGALDFLEDAAAAPGDSAIEAVLDGTDLAAVRAAWAKAISRRSDDPEGAITAARTLLETVCKDILDERSVPYSPSADLPELYRRTAKALRLAPSDHTEQLFKQILGGVQTVVTSLGAIRNQLSDSHAIGRASGRPLPRHAQLAVNLAGAVAAFLAETHRARREAGE